MGTRHHGFLTDDEGNRVHYDFVEHFVLTRKVCRALWGTIRFVWRWRDWIAMVPLAAFIWWIVQEPFLLIIVIPLGFAIHANHKLNPEPMPWEGMFDDR